MEESNSSYFFIEGIFYINETVDVCNKLTVNFSAWLRGNNSSLGVEQQPFIMENHGLTEDHYINAAKWIATIWGKERSYKDNEPAHKRKKTGVSDPRRFNTASNISENCPPEIKGLACLQAATSKKRGRPQKSDNRKQNVSHRFLKFSGQRSDTSNNVPNIEFRPMSITFLSSLQFRLGVRYLYCHLNACEHFMYFSDVHLRSFDSEESDISVYPKMTYRGNMWRRRCGVCNLWSAKCVVYDDRLAVDNPTFYCQHCYHMLHYDEQGNLLYNDFKVFPYLHDMI